MDKIKVAIIGGGASGLFTAALLNRSNVNVTIFEKNNKLGKKILASGNGKCNFTNLFDNTDKYNNIFANKIINKYDVNKTIDFFCESGLVYKNDDQGRCYPVSECASSVLDCLKSNLDGVRIKLECPVEEINVEKGKCSVKYDNIVEIFDYVVCCSGSLASNLGSDKAYSYLNKLNIKLKKLKGSLTPVEVRENVQSLTGIRVKCIAYLLDEFDNLIYKEKGEVIFKNNGLSGISIFNISSYVNRDINKKYKISLDVSNGMEVNKLKEYFTNKNKDNLFKGFLNDKLGDYIGSKCSINKVNQLDKKSIDTLINNVKDLRFEVVGLYSLKDSQVCSGGILLEEVDDSLRLKKYPSIYIGGELLDIDGLCGGYNLQFAWSSGGVIAEDIKRRIK